MVADRSAGVLRRAVRGSSRTGLIAIEEAASITAAREAGLELLQVFIRRDAKSDDLAQSVTEPVIEVAPAEYDEIFATTRKPAVVAVAARPRAPSGRALARRDGDLVVLDGLSGPGNA